MFKCCLCFLLPIACGAVDPEDGCCVDEVKLGFKNGFTVNMSYALHLDSTYSLIPKGAVCESEWHGYQAMDNKGHGSQQLEVFCKGVSYKSINIMSGGQYFVTKKANGTETCKVLRAAATRLPTLGSYVGGSGGNMCYGKAASSGLTRYVGPVLYGGTKFSRYAFPDQSDYADVDVENGCLPLRLTLMGRVVTHFTNFKAGIPAHALDIPAACTKAVGSVMV
jgi:hypothetical protein